ncbi:uncharacterized protein BKCO1_4100095 [Diplodia corticola]|uniref:Uncharacterized protein n=1 Tax=Diplodia corticola TaxID=236234 RepID=A0A1J9RUK1_9PEZI|nr:uncharacterized protein BKCO1_4100095 [Diplodia corticola]OJD32103.1 hypothetical protein BKCO1_4100095 [Diplodia corticola]
MVSRKEMARQDGTAMPTASAPPPTPAACLPGYVRFPLLIVLSLATSLSLLSATSEFIDPQLREVSQSSSSNEDVKVLSSIAWKLTELSVAWFGNFDDIDLVALSVLTHAPWYYLLTTFYAVEPTTALLCLAIDALSLAGPTRLLRPRSPQHNPRAPRAAVPNAAILADAQTTFATALLAAAVHAVALFAALQSFLPAFLAVRFDGLASLEAAHAATVPALLAALVPVGFAAREFVLVPALAARESSADAARKAAAAFDPATSGLREHLVHNLWWFGKGARVLVKRAAVAAALTAAHVGVHASAMLRGGDVVGALGYAGVWVGAGVTTGVVYAWVENV